MQQLSLLTETDSPPVQYWPGFLEPAEADRLLQQSQALEWRQNQFPILGKLVPLPRLELMFGDSEAYSYVYSGSVEFKAQPWPPFLAELRDRVEAATGYRYQIGVGNLYRSGQDSISYHADDEASQGTQPAIASVSLGATRTFRIKPKQRKGQSYGYDLSHGDLLLMQPGCQEEWVHALPKTSKNCGVRINWTFRPYTTL
ncbi:MAG: alpha-ketoglutarate-dependent dioxygenase AlkB [Aphanocapsa sp. GSE-SYN-MK-11-07L]|jgi:alkylated DNA repair dioxygenase AlkB|nr:alpha-ketoglutarate-dependent dioxygenase AlkB [Aphanocapsa sp. GSE-SYN-MK-11-07L]